MKQKNLFFILFLTNLILHPSSIFCLKLKSMQSFSELKDIEADGINLQDMNKIKDIAGLDSMLSNVATDKIAPQSKPNPSDVESIRNQLLKETMGQSDNSLDNKSININENDIDKIIKDKEQQIEVNPNAVLANIDSLTKSKPAKEEETLTGMESCDDIKKYGKQRLYCEDKFLLKFVK
jgi:hypothetical protein